MSDDRVILFFLVMLHFFAQVPVRVAGGLLFELLGQSAGDPYVNEDDIPVVLRSWQAQNFLVTVLHIKGSVSTMNVLGITEVQVLVNLQKFLLVSGVPSCSVVLYVHKSQLHFIRNCYFLEVIMSHRQFMKS